MDEDLKDLIDTVEVETKTRAQLESQIKSMKEEINRLKFTIKEQLLLIEEQGDQISFAQSDLPSEINILKEMITSQRRDLTKRDNDIERLNQKIDELTNYIDKSKDGFFEVQKNDLFEAQELILKLSKENEAYRNQIEELKNQFELLESEKLNLMDINKAQTEENLVMVNIKRLNFQLMEQNGLLRVEIESLKSQLNDKFKEAHTEQLESANKKIDELSTERKTLKIQIQELEKDKENSLAELELSNQIIEDLESKIEDYDSQLKFLKKELEKADEPTMISIEDSIEFAQISEAYNQLKIELNEVQKENFEFQKSISEMEDYKTQIKFLQGELKKANEPPIIPTEDALNFKDLRDECDQLKSTLINLEKENEDLNKKLKNFGTDQLKKLQKDIPARTIAYDFPKHFQFSLFNRMYNLLDDNNKETVINILINDLSSPNNDIKRNAIRILSEIKDKKAYEKFLELIHDEDWLTRYNLIKALSKFDFEIEEFKELLKKLSMDADVDVRELAIKMLSEISKQP